MTKVMARVHGANKNDSREMELAASRRGSAIHSITTGGNVPVLSYLAYPAHGKKDSLASALRDLPECEVIESDNDDLLILVTQTESHSAELELEKRLDKVESLSMLALVFGHRADATTRQETHS